jgi:transketolase
MKNEALNLNKDIFTEKMEKVSTREGYGKGLLEAGERDSRVVLLSADLTESTKGNYFRERFPERFVQVGVAEQNLVTVASGMASMGKIPFTNSYAVFSPGRNLEQIRTTVCYNNQPVKIIGSHAGISVGPDGGTHQALEDIAIMRTLPNMKVISPCDYLEAHKATLAMISDNSPFYMRLARGKTPVITAEKTFFEVGKAVIFYGDSDSEADVGIVATGPLVYESMVVAKKLENQKNIKIKVLNLSTIKPLDEEVIVTLARQTGALVTVEEHQIFGGMGSAISEFLAQNLPTPIEFVGVKDRFGESGEADELLQKYGMGKESIEEAVERVLKRKR